MEGQRSAPVEGEQEFAQVIAVAPESRRDPEPVIGILETMGNRAIVVRQERCAKVRNRNVSCLKCAAACTSGCISVDEGQLKVSPEKCVGCGTCATVCPTCALESRNPNDVQLAAQTLRAARGGRVVVACHLALEAARGLVDDAQVAEVVCAGRVEESLLAGLTAKGVSEVCVVCGNCGSCVQRHGRDVVERVARSTRSLLQAWGADVEIRIGEAFPAEVLAEGVLPDEVERAMEAFFQEERGNDPVSPLREEAPASGPAQIRTTTGVHVMKDGTLPHFLPDRRERLLSALFELGSPQSDRIASRLWGWVVIDGSKCTSCRMCSTFCPTGAIARFDEEDGTFGVTHFPGDCVKCKSCVDICPASAITMMDDVRPSYLMSGDAHRYVMKPRETQIGCSHQILSHMRTHLKGSNIFER